MVRGMDDALVGGSTLLGDSPVAGQGLIHSKSDSFSLGLGNACSNTPGTQRGASM